MDEQDAVAPSAEASDAPETIEAALEALVAAPEHPEAEAATEGAAPAGAVSDAPATEPEIDWKKKAEEAEKAFKGLQPVVQRLTEAERQREREAAQRKQADFEESLRHMSPEQQEIVLEKQRLGMVKNVLAAAAAKLEHDQAMTEVGLRERVIDVITKRSNLDPSVLAQARSPREMELIEQTALLYRQQVESSTREATRQARADNGADAFTGGGGGSFSGKAPETMDDANALLAKYLRG